MHLKTNESSSSTTCKDSLRFSNRCDTQCSVRRASSFQTKKQSQITFFLNERCKNPSYFSSLPRHVSITLIRHNPQSRPAIYRVIPKSKFPSPPKRQPHGLHKSIPLHSKVTLLDSTGICIKHNKRAAQPRSAVNQGLANTKSWYANVKFFTFWLITTSDRLNPSWKSYSYSKPCVTA
jgi:hypothetical protein